MFFCLVVRGIYPPYTLSSPLKNHFFMCVFPFSYGSGSYFWSNQKFKIISKEFYTLKYTFFYFFLSLLFMKCWNVFVVNELCMYPQLKKIITVQNILWKQLYRHTLHTIYINIQHLYTQKFSKITIFTTRKKIRPKSNCQNEVFCQKNTYYIVFYYIQGTNARFFLKKINQINYI